ncbi:hypothetical protein J4E83_010961 [Alternaria metachromatica]|uniref:uncharacterized protein n=1 Tax=Alternaria metachromatica TaxID=283354 RepID=UPI0020C2DEF2|nr:uncharacterized protein J4E83_010961 [Alternaria metachromatica]KAI4604810.1 hypothetical protein J4E83_010961 [Alternaria metachromatica]
MLQISLCETYKVILQLLREFDLELLEPEKEWETHNYWFNKPTKVYTKVQRSLNSPLDRSNHESYYTRSSFLMPTTAFLALPAEVRINIYNHISPVNTSFASYSGLLQTCHLIRKEWKYEAKKCVSEEYIRFQSLLTTLNIRILTSARDSSKNSKIVLRLPPLDPTAGTTRLPNFIPWHWSWITTVIVIFSHEWPRTYRSQLAMYNRYCDAHKALCRDILAPGAHTIPEYDKLCETTNRSSIRHISLRWYNVPQDTRVERRFGIIPEPWLQYGEDFEYSMRLWDIQNRRDREGGTSCFSVVWRRRSWKDVPKWYWVSLFYYKVLRAICLVAVGWIVMWTLDLLYLEYSRT